MPEHLTTNADAAYAAKIAQFEREVAAYDAMWPELLKAHKGKWVAIYQEQLVDEDDDERRLYERIRAKYGYHEPILITEVLETRHRIVDIPGIDLDLSTGDWDMSQQLTTNTDTAHAAKMAQFQREVAAYDAMWPELVKTHLGKFVAFYQGQLVDQDDDERALAQRMFDRYGYDHPFLVQQVVITRYPIVDVPPDTN